MDALSDYVTVWIVYVVAAISGLALLWYMTRGFGWLWLRDVIRSSVAIALLIPIKVDASGSELAPAFIVFAFDSLTKGIEEGERAGLPIMICLIIVTLALTVYHLFQFIGRRRQVTD